jgi:hypothetical protein
MMGGNENGKRKEVKRSDKYRDFFLLPFPPSCHRAPDVDVRVNNAPLNAKGCGKCEGMRENSFLMGQLGHIKICPIGTCAWVW